MGLALLQLLVQDCHRCCGPGGFDVCWFVWLCVCVCVFVSIKVGT